MDEVNKEAFESPEKIGFSAASLLARETSEKILALADTSLDNIRKILYTHTASVLFLESILLKSAGKIFAQFPLETAAMGLKVIAEGKLIGDLYRAVKVERVRVGEHMRFAVFPFKDSSATVLSDGFTIKYGDEVGEIDIMSNLPVLEPGASIIAFTRSLFRKSEESLAALAKLCESDDESVKGVVAFRGSSHFAGPLAKRLGFDLFEIADPIQYFNALIAGKLLSKMVSLKNHGWRDLQKNYKAPREAFISRTKLVELYGGQLGSDDAASENLETDK